MEDQDRSKKPKNDELEQPETDHVSEKSFQIKGTVVLMKKNLLGLKDLTASVVDMLDELRGKKVSLQLISSTTIDQDSETYRGKLGKRAYLEEWITKISSMTSGDVIYKVTFEWNKEMGIPGAFKIENFHHNEFYLKTLTLEDVPGHGRVHFVCNSWLYPASYYKKDRIFFANQAYLPNQTPESLKYYREEELESLRGNGTGKLEEWDRVYDYDIYNDLSDPDKDEEHIRPIIGGSDEYPYPRRGRTGRPPSSSDPKTESRLPIYKGLSIYVPRDERFSHIKLSDAAAYGLKSLLQNLGADFKALFNKTPREIDSFDDVLKLYEWEDNVSDKSWLDRIGEHISFELIKELFRSDGETMFKFPVPQVIKEDKLAWRSDEEFGRELLAGLSPVVIKRLEEFPPTCKLDPKIYGNQSSTISEEDILNNLDGLSITEAIEGNKLFILDHHESLMPFLRRINNTSIKTYATRTLLFLKNDGTLKPIAIELSLPHPEGDRHGSISRVSTPAHDGVESIIWQLAKAYVAVDDSGYHQLICHWLHTHATIEPFIIATNRQLSMLHPIHKLLQPHFRDTMNVNALARQTLLNAGGFLEITLFQGKYSVEFSSMLYREWTFPDQALPADLIKRGVAVKDPESKQGVHLLIEDYPYAVDGLEIWAAIKSWVEDYCKIYYESDNTVQEDVELQLWWNEIREKGHGDKKHEPWWPKMQTREELIDSCTIIIWTASALHAAVNFGQYPYGGHVLNRPATSRRLIPEPGSREYEEMLENPEKAYLKTITSLQLSVLGISLVEILSRHTADEVFLGQRESPEWTKDEEALKAFDRFGERLGEIEKRIVERNEDPRLKNRLGPVKMPYTLLYPSSGVGLTGKGIPNSISI